MKIFEFAGIVFNADTICTVQKVSLTEEKSDNTVAWLQIVTLAGGVNFSFNSVEERDAKFADIKKELKEL